MRKSNFYKTKRILALLLLTFGAITSTIGNHFLITGLNRNGYNNNVKSEVLGDDEKFDEPLPRSAEPQDFNGIGEQINITLHQSLIDTATKQFSNLDVSNSFTEPFPLFAGYETSFVNISINNINAPNKTLNLELATSSSDQISTDLFAYSFTIRNTCIIQNFSIYLSESGGSGGSVDIKILIFNATYDSIDSRIEPHTNTGLIDITQSVPDEHTGQWYNFTLNKVLDAANTYNNTFFIYFYQNTNFNFARGYYHYQTGTTTDNYLVYRDSGAGWQALARDISSQVIVGLNDNTPRPTEINLKVNGTLVNNLGIGNQGFYSSTQKFSSADGNIDFEVTADWWEVSCDIIRVEINFTKIDLKANSIFKILSSSDNVQWNVSVVGGLNYFDSRVTDFNTINFTIPKTWLSNSIKVFNDTSEWLSADINKDFTKNGYRYVQVLNAGNGSNWYLLANSTNLLSSINTYVSGIQRQIVNFSNNVEFRGTFSEVISNGVLNISVYSPILREMNHTNVLDISTGAPNTVFSVSTWDISVDARDYGVFKAQMIWNNNTAAGFLDYFFTIVADTEFTVLDPPGGRIYKSGESFEISIQYRDIIKPEGLSDATIEYSLNGTYKSKNVAYLGSGIYNITIYVDDPDFTKFGYITIPIRASKQFYVNLTTSFMFHRQITTIITPGNSADLGDVIRGQNVSYTFNYADTLTNPITEASWSVVGSSYGFDSFLKNEGGGGYTMHLDTDNVNVAGSPYFFTFEIYSIGNETQIIQLRVNVQIITTRIESTSWIPNIPRNSGLNQTFQFYFNDTTNDQGIQNLISSDIIVRNNATGSIWTPGWNLINPLNDGWYILNISLANRNAGWYTLQVNASKFPNYDY
ncbi:MAG: hypothetical protein ACFFA2_10325, partial [Promethearchaeota archaeon]